MSTFKAEADWAQLFRIASQLIDQVNYENKIIDAWTFGGGTAMMLQIEHRISRDVDIFLSDVQQLPFLDPKSRDFKFEVRPSAYEGDGSRFLKLAFAGIGEIDFIVAGLLTAAPTTSREIEGVLVNLETIEEIIAKKIHYRGASIKVRDIFDIAAAGKTRANEITRALAPFKADVESAIRAIDRLNPEFVLKATFELAVLPDYEDVAKDALKRAREILAAV